MDGELRGYGQVAAEVLSPAEREAAERVDRNVRLDVRLLDDAALARLGHDPGEQGARHRDAVAEMARRGIV